MDVASGLTALVATKLVVYTFGSLIHFFLMVLILGNRRLRRFECLLFALMAALFMWYVGNLWALNISLYYGAGPAVQTGFSCTVCLLGFMAAVPLLVHVQTEYGAAFVPIRRWQRLAVAAFYLPVMFSPWLVGRMLGQLGIEPLVALGGTLRWLLLWAVAALLFAAGLNASFRVQRQAAQPDLARFHGYLAVLQALLAAGWAAAYLGHALPPIGGLGGYLPAGLMLAGILPSALMGYSIFRYNFLDLRVQRNVVYAVAVGFGFLIYLNFMRRLSGLLEAYHVLPPAVTEGVMIFVLVVFLEPLKRLVSRALRREFASELATVQKLAAQFEEHAKQTGDVASLQALVEQRVPAALGLESARLIHGPPPTGTNATANVHQVRISRGGENLGFLEAVPAAAELSGEQMAALEMLAGRLAAALELCRLIADKVSLERALAAKEKMAFLGEMAARIAHNVKNPLSGMKSIVQVMEEDKSLPEKTRRDCRVLVEEIDRLNRNISQVLRYAKPARDIEHPIDLPAVVRRVAAILRAEAERRHVDLQMIDCGPCLVQGGEEAASDIISNLLVNALEASREGGAIAVRLTQPNGSSEFIELAVEDHGVGIGRDKLGKIFQPFFTTRAGGTGLGLAIVKRRVDEIGGSVDCQSPVPARNATPAHAGTQFVVSFRRAGGELR